MDPVTVQFYKNPRALHWGFAGFLLGEDEYGCWVGLPQGSDRWKGETRCSPTGEDAVQCFPHEGWWVLHFNGPVRPISHFVDITTQPTMAEGRIEMIDLDLDLVVLGDGTVEVVDEDEFEINQVELGYSREMIRRARNETERVARLLRRGEEPFFAVAEHWLQVVISGSSPDPATG
jgi:protein associated with RNAse G/E